MGRKFRRSDVSRSYIGAKGGFGNVGAGAGSTARISNAAGPARFEKAIRNRRFGWLKDKSIAWKA